MGEEGRTQHFLAAVASTLAIPIAGRPSSVVSEVTLPAFLSRAYVSTCNVVAFSASRHPTRKFPLLIGSEIADRILDGFAHPEIIDIFQHVDCQEHDGSYVAECPAWWKVKVFGPEDSWRLIKVARLERMPRGESVELYVELGNSSGGSMLLSAVAAKRLRDFVRGTFAPLRTH